MGIVRAVCVFIAQNARRKKGVLSEDIAAILLCTALYLHPKSSYPLYVQYKRVSSMFFNVFCMLLKILFYMGKVLTVWVSIAENARLKTGVLSENFDAILLFTVLYLHPKSSHTLFVQYKTVSSMFLNFYFSWENCVQCCFALQRMRVERGVFHSKISQRSCNV